MTASTSPIDESSNRGGGFFRRNRRLLAVVGVANEDNKAAGNALRMIKQLATTTPGRISEVDVNAGFKEQNFQTPVNFFFQCPWCLGNINSLIQKFFETAKVCQQDSQKDEYVFLSITTHSDYVGKYQLHTMVDERGNCTMQGYDFIGGDENF